MKHLLISTLVLLFPFISLSAQESALPAIYESVEVMADRYELNAVQQEQLKQIVSTRNQNLSAIAPLRQQNAVTYWQKRKAIYSGQQASIERLLTTDTQRETFRQQQIANRRAESDLIKSLLAEGHSRADAKTLMLAERY